MSKNNLSEKKLASILPKLEKCLVGNDLSVGDVIFLLSSIIIHAAILEDIPKKDLIVNFIMHYEHINKVLNERD